MTRGALTCFHKALLLSPEDDENRFAQAELYRDIGEPRRALEDTSNVLLERLPDEPEIPKTLALTLHAMGDSDAAEETLDAFVRRAPNKVASDVVNILAQLKSFAGKHADAAALVLRMLEPVRAYQRELAERERAESAERAGRDAYEEAMERGAEGRRRDARRVAPSRRQRLRATPPRDTWTFPWISTCASPSRNFVSVVTRRRGVRSRSFARRPCGNTRIYGSRRRRRARTSAVRRRRGVYTALLDAPEYDTPELWRKIAACIRARHRRGSPRTPRSSPRRRRRPPSRFTARRSRADPSSLDAKLPLAAALISRGRSREAAEVLPAAEELATMRKTDAIRVLALRRKAGGDSSFLEVALPMVCVCRDGRDDDEWRRRRGHAGGVREPWRKI